MTAFRRVVVVGLDGLEPGIAEAMMAAGELPNLSALRSRGGYARVATTYPAQTPVAWSTFATGVNPGGHGIFDFLRRDPSNYLPDPALNRYEQKSAFLPPKAVNLRGGTPLWNVLGQAGVASTVIRCPCTYPPDDFKGRMLSGMGVPDVRGGFGTSSFYTSAEGARAQESEVVVPLGAKSGKIATHLVGPRNPKAGEAKFAFTIEPKAASVVIHSDGNPGSLEVKLGQWSDWLKVKFKLGMLQAVHGMVRFHLVSLAPQLELYASPVNFDPATPMFPISHPWDYAGALQREVGTFYTTGMVEDHGGLNNGRFGEAAYVDQCAQVMREREAMLQLELQRTKDGLLFCLFDTPDRLQHMLWRFREPGHPANVHGMDAEMLRSIESHYRECDAVVGRVVEHAGNDETLVIVLSDHGFGSFQRGVHLNSWLLEHGYLALKAGVKPGPEAGDFLHGVDWDRTRAYAVGLGSMYLNVRGREANGIVPPDEAAGVAASIKRELTGLRDEEKGGAVALRGVALRDEIYQGAFAHLAPDLVALFERGYRVSWATALGGVPAGLFEDNDRRWSGDHIVDPPLVPGVLFMSTAFRADGPRLLDMAPTILAALKVPAAPSMEGRSLLH